MEALLYCGCGLDIHKEVIEACILRGIDDNPEIIRHTFGTTKPELQLLIEWLEENDCYTTLFFFLRETPAHRQYWL